MTTTELCPPGLLAALAEAGLSWRELTRRADDILLFGSRAQGAGRPDSDWDLLCVGNGPTRPRSGVDIVWVGPRTSLTSRWLGSELASHILAFGLHLQGECAWISHVQLSPAAVEAKRRRVIARMSALQRLWSCVRPTFKVRHGRLLRRELQRVQILCRGEPVPPARHLDDGWSADYESADGWRSLTSWMTAEESARARALVDNLEAQSGS